MPGACFALFDQDNRLIGQECDESDGADGSTTITFPNGVAEGTYRLARSQPGSDQFGDEQEIAFPRADSEPVVIVVDAA